jgi:hypothetical protein
MTENYNPVSEKYLADIRRDAWINLLWEYINEELFAVHSQKRRVILQDDSSLLPPSPSPPPKSSVSPFNSLSRKRHTI